MMGAKAAAIAARVAWLGFMVGLLPAPAIAVGPDPTSSAAADTTSACLTGPKGAAPQGEHWYYRVERGTRRHCWYTHAALPRKMMKQVAQAANPAKAPDATAPAPLELSVANARAEADLSAPPQSPAAATPPRTVSPTGETKSWTLADRWADHRDVRPPAQPLPPQVAQPAASAPTKPPFDSANAPQDNLLEMAAGTIALLGLSMVLIATLIRRRQQDRDNPDRRFPDRPEPKPNVTGFAALPRTPTARPVGRA